jgi:hypothetical protein
MVLAKIPAATLVWDANTETNLAGYNVYYSQTNGAITQVDVGLNTSFSLSGLAVSPTPYVFYVTAYNTDGIESDPSDSVTYTSIASQPVPPSIILAPSSSSVLFGQPFSLSVQASGSPTLAYQWLKNGAVVAGATNISYSVNAAQTADAGTYSVRISNSVGSVISPGAVITVLINPPIITFGPATQSLNVGASLVLSVQASGTGPLSYQWLKNGAAISGAVSSSFSIASIQTSDAGSYAVRVTNSGGSVTSSTAVVTVQVNAPVIVQAPVSQSLTVGGALALSVQASGTGPFSYQWLKNGAAISGAVSSTFSIASVQTSDAGNYSVRVTNSGGSVISSAAVVSVSAGVPQILIQPQSQSVTVGATLTLTVQASGGAPLSYRWVKSGSYVSAASSSPDFSISNIQVGQAGSYSVEVSNSSGKVTSQPAMVTVTGAPVIITQPVGQSLTEGSTLTLSVEASGAAMLTYRWIKNGSYITAASSSGATYSVASVTTVDAGAYTVEVSNSAGTITSQPAQVIVAAGAAPVITRQPASLSLSPGATAAFSVDATGAGTLAYQWLKNGVAISGAVNAAYSIPSVQSSDAGTYSVRVSNSAGSVTSQNAALSVSGGAPQIVVQPVGQSVTVGTTLNLTVQASGGTPLTYRWVKSGSYVSAASSSPDFTIAAIQVSQAGSYTVEVSNSSGKVTSQPAVVTVVGAPVIVTQPASQSLNLGSPLTLSVEATGAATLTYRWIKNGSYITAASSSGSTYSVASITSNDAGSYSVEVSNAAGTITSQAAVITIGSGGAPVISGQPASISANIGSVASFSVDATGSGTLAYQWLKNGVAISGAVNSGFSIGSVQSGDAGSYSVRVSNSAGSVTSQAATLLVQGSAPQIVVQPLSQSVTVGTTLSLTVQASGGTPLTYRWVKSGSYVSAASSSPDFTIAAIQVSQAGSYTVEVSNSSGKVTSQPAVVTVLGAPVIVTPPASQSVSLGSPLALNVEATGAATLTYRWIKNGSYITAASSSGSTYNVAAVTSNDAGSYSVEVSNSAGTVTSTAAVITIGSAGGAPVISRQPASVSVNAGGAASFSVEATGSGTLGYQWLKNGVAISGAVNSGFSIGSVQSGDAGSYSVRVSNSAGSVTSQAATLSVLGSAPQIVVQPRSQSVTVGTTLTLTVQATGGVPLSYRWVKDGSYVSAASSSPDFTIAAIQVGQAGNYSVEVSNATGMARSQMAAITVVGAPVITTQPLSQSVATGTALTLSVQAAGAGTLNYRWIRNGSYIAGATNATYTVASASSRDSGLYAVEISNLAGTVSSQIAVITLKASSLSATSGATLSISPVNGGISAAGLQLTISGAPGTYQIQQCNEFGTEAWTPIQTVTISEESSSIVVSPMPHAFFRTVQIEQP